MNGSHHWARAFLNAIKHAMPLPRMMQTFHAGAAFDLAQIQAGAKMIALARDHHSTAALRQRSKSRFNRQDHAVRNGVAFVRPLNADVRYSAVKGGRNFRHGFKGIIDSVI
jgi:hypothetical protein